MASKKKPTKDQREREREQNRASRMRAKKRAGKELSSEDAEWLAAYDESKRPYRTEGDSDDGDDSPLDEGAIAPDDAPAGSNSGADAIHPDNTPVAAPSDDPPTQTAPPPSDLPKAAPPKSVDGPQAAQTGGAAKAPTIVGAVRAGDLRTDGLLPKSAPLPRPPRVAIAESDDKGKAIDWKAKYRGNLVGREATCNMIGGYWQGILIAMADSMKEAGIDPIVDPVMLGGAIVLAVDELLPPDVQVSNKTLAIGGSTAIIVQRFIKRDAIAKAQAKAKDRREHQEWKEKVNRSKEKAEEIGIHLVPDAGVKQDRSSPIVAPAAVAAPPNVAPSASETNGSKISNGKGSIPPQDPAPTISEPTPPPYDPDDPGRII